jgi:hypothetical protein
MSVLHMLDEYSQLITWILVAIGWYLVNMQNDKREARKELRAKVTELCKLVSDIEADTTVFYARSGDAEQAAADRGKITHKLSLLGVGTSQIAPRYHPVIETVVAFRKSITPDEFDEESRPPLKYSHPTLDGVRFAAEQLVSELEAAFSKRYSQTARLTEEHRNN